MAFLRIKTFFHFTGRVFAAKSNPQLHILLYGLGDEGTDFIAIQTKWNTMLTKKVVKCIYNARELLNFIKCS